MGLDLRLGENDRPDLSAGPQAIPALGKLTDDELRQILVTLLQRCDELGATVTRLDARMQELASFAPTETALRQQGEAQERALREGFARLERHWAETAGRYRTLADELARRAASGRPPASRFSQLRVVVGGLIVVLGLAGALTLWLGAQPGRVLRALGLQPHASESLPAKAKPVRPKSR